MPAAISRAPSAPWEQGGVHAFPLRVSPQRQMDSGNSWALAPPSLPRVWTRLPAAQPSPRGLGRLPQPSVPPGQGGPRTGEKRVHARASQQHPAALPAPRPWGLTGGEPQTAYPSGPPFPQTLTWKHTPHFTVYTWPSTPAVSSDPQSPQGAPRAPTPPQWARAGQGRGTVHRMRRQQNAAGALPPPAAPCR